MEKLDSKNIVFLSVFLLNILATGYTVFNPKMEEKLFNLYSVSVAGLWGALTIQGDGAKDEK